MSALLRFAKTTLLGGLLVLLPIYLVVLLLIKSLQGMTALLMPIIGLMPVSAAHHTLLALTLVLVASFLAGLLLLSAAGRRYFEGFERVGLMRIPGYGLIRSIARRTAGEETGEFDVALAEIEDALVPAFVVERHADGRCTVFVPSSPTPFSGAVYVLAPERVHVLDVPIRQAFAALTRWGAGTRELVEAMEAHKEGDQTQSI